jgi:ribosomal protein S19
MTVDYKKRIEKVMEADRNLEKRVHNGKGYVKVTVSSELGRGKKWGEFVKTRKPCVAARKPKKGVRR